ncbi:MAG: sulfate ABC transporter permease subunit CysT [Candidatus Binatia bacterium]|nr:sulfate ABC transporter permease subunit CysT [Candidatus Binatia bacterium]
MSRYERRILPGFRAALTLSVVSVAVVVALPLGAVLLHAASLGWHGFWAAVLTPRALAAYQLTFGAALLAATVATLLGSVVAWALVRATFPARGLVDALVDVPLALPTAVAGLVYANLYAPNGFLGQYLTRWGVTLAYSRAAVVLVLVFVSFPLAVRSLQPVIANLERELEEAAACLGASRWQTLVRVQIPQLVPALLTGFALAFSRAAGEYGSVVFVSGNKPFVTEIAPVLVVARLEEFAYAEAAAVASVLLGASLLVLLTIEVLHRWGARYVG